MYIAAVMGPGVLVLPAVAAETAGLPLEKVEVHKMMLGGGFGRRGAPQDFVRQGVAIAMALPGTPVKAETVLLELLTAPWTISAEDRYLDPPGAEYLEALGPQTKGGISDDIRLVKDGKVFYSGGMFIGWKDKPALHGTWDGLAIINSLFKYYPDARGSGIPQTRVALVLGNGVIRHF